MQKQIQFGKILSLVTITALAAPAFAKELRSYEQVRAEGMRKLETSRPADPKNPTWQEYNTFAMKCSVLEHDPEKAKKYAEASFIQLTKSLNSAPNQALTHKDKMIASSLCVQKMYVDGNAIMKGPDGSKMTDAKDLEDLVEEQNKHFGAMNTAHKVLKKVSPQGADQVAFELTKCSEVMAKTKTRLEKAQAESKTESKTQ